MPFLNPNHDSRHKIKMVNIAESIPYKALAVDILSLLPLEPMVLAGCKADSCRSVGKCLPFVRDAQNVHSHHHPKAVREAPPAHQRHIRGALPAFRERAAAGHLVHSSACLWWLTYALEGYPIDGWDNFVQSSTSTNLQSPTVTPRRSTGPRKR